MKKITLLIAFLAFGFTSVKAQTFGATAGYDLAAFSVSDSSIGGQSQAVDGESGFFAGIFGEIAVTDKFNLRGDVIYSAVENYNQVRLPITIGYALNEKFDVYAGPSAHIVLEDQEGIESFFVGLDAKIAFNITEQIFLIGGYNLGLTNSFESDTFNFRSNSFNIGIGYKFLND